MPIVDSLKVFSEVVATRNFTQAAKRLGLTPSAVSKQISMLEKRLGVRLLNRTTRTVNPTEAGQLYADRCRQILDELDEIEDLIADMDTTPRGTLKIAAEPIFGRAILSRILNDYGKQYPHVRTELFLTDHSLELVKQGFDAGIHLGHLADPALTGITIANHSVILCASIEYIDEHGMPGNLDDLRSHSLIKISSMEFLEPRQLDDYFTNLGIVDQFNLTVNDTDMAYHAVMNGIGIAPLPSYLVLPQIQRGRLTQVLPDITTEAHPVLLVYPSHRRVSGKSKSFIDFLTTYFTPSRR
ncbi:MAG: LysR family transcriptional regulator [Pseudomonadales bacterium]|jgi:DNA-binding transcriptional LysR family regulator